MQNKMISHIQPFKKQQCKSVLFHRAYWQQTYGFPGGCAERHRTYLY